MYVYIMQCANYHKIGVSKNPEKRKQTIQTHNPLDVYLIAKKNTNSARKIEKELHNRFEYRRTRGEWFELREKEINILKIEYGFQFLTEAQTTLDEYDKTLDQLDTKKYRLNNLKMEKIIDHFEDIFDCSIVNYNAIKKVCLKYDVDIIFLSINKMFEIGYDSNKAYNKLNSFCKYESEKQKNPDRYTLSIIKSIFKKHYNEILSNNDIEYLEKKLNNIINVDEVIEFAHKSKYKLDSQELYRGICNVINTDYDF